jgi:serine/threonine protein kinase
MSLQNLHRLNIVHRDIKPSNMMLTTSGKCVLIDLGLARHVAAESCPKAMPVADHSAGGVEPDKGVSPELPNVALFAPRTQGELAFARQKARAEEQASQASAPALSKVSGCTGTLLYMAPELAKSSDHVSLRYPKALDIWSVGASVLEMMQNTNALRNPRRRENSHTTTITDASSFVAACLQQRPGDRPTVSALLNSPWLKELSPSSVDWEAYRVQALAYLQH